MSDIVIGFIIWLILMSLNYCYFYKVLIATPSKKMTVLEAQEQIYNLVCKHFPNDDNFKAFYKEFAEIRKELE